jgi:hypothetical protein
VPPAGLTRSSAGTGSTTDGRITAGRRAVGSDVAHPALLLRLLRLSGLPGGGNGQPRRFASRTSTTAPRMSGSSSTTSTWACIDTGRVCPVSMTARWAELLVSELDPRDVRRDSVRRGPTSGHERRLEMASGNGEPRSAWTSVWCARRSQPAPRRADELEPSDRPRKPDELSMLDGEVGARSAAGEVYSRRRLRQVRHHDCRRRWPLKTRVPKSRSSSPARPQRGHRRPPGVASGSSTSSARSS